MCTLSRNRFLSTLMALVVPAAGLLSFASLAGPRLYSQEGVRPKAKSPKIEKMLEERLATVREMVRIVAERFKNGQGTIEQIREANRMLLEAELDACASDKDRVAILESAVGEAKLLEERAQAMVKAGQAQGNLSLAVKADRLQVEIALERLRAKPVAKPRGEAKPGPEVEDQVALAEKHVAIRRALVKVAEVQVQIVAAKMSVVKAQFDGAKAAEAYAELQMKRFTALAGTNAVSAELVDEQRAKLDAARALRASVQGKLAESEGQVELERARVDVARLEAEEAELRLKQLKAKWNSAPGDR